MKSLVKHNSITDASVGRLLQFLSNANSCFAIMGARDRDTGELRTDELYQLVTQYNDLHHNGYNKSFGRYEYIDGSSKGTTIDEPGIIIYNIPLGEALSIAEKINQGSVAYKDKNKFGICYTDGSADIDFDNRCLSAKIAEKFGAQIADIWSGDDDHSKSKDSHFIFTAYAGRPNSWKHGRIINADTANMGVSYSEIYKICL